MLDTDTKRRIDSCRDILVGKVPDPKSQVEQITIALIYKFMDDMDAEAEEMGGKRSFFAGDYAKYGWRKLMAPGMGGFDVLALYSEAIGKMNENPGIPALFRDIFKNAYLPYRDPETLRAFLKEIDGFTYDHSERLGDAFEYLLSVLGSQGDAGQFRTPRHIIDFMVEIIDPKKNETLLDPACGTAGFLISAWKHILKANTKERQGDQLTPDERKQLAANIHGYDISPDMVRLSLVNMYLHGFTDPHIDEYDTLTSEERWNHYSDIILANPPFMSPKGGIKPHKRFSVQATRSEVLFVDYIAEHLTPTGRAAVIVPEGIIFQSQTAYKALRKLLVENHLVAVISLPAGVFQPYSGVKTSVLILDKALAKKAESIGFFKVENDGFGLGAQRRPIDKNDLPQIRAEVGEYLRRLRAGESVAEFQPTLGLIVDKAKVATNDDYNLSGERYREGTASLSEHPHVRLGEVCEINPESANPAELYPNSDFNYIDISCVENGSGKFLGANCTATDEAPSRARRSVKQGDVLMSTVRPNLKAFALLTEVPNRAIASTGFAVLRAKPDHLLPGFLINVLRDDRSVDQMIGMAGKGAYPSINQTDVESIKIPLPPLVVQKEIVAEIDGYQKVIDGARAVLDNYRPHIPVHPEWPMVKLAEAADFISGYAFKSADMTTTPLDASYRRVVKIGNVGRDGQLDMADAQFHPYSDDLARFVLKVGDIVMAMTGATVGKVATVSEEGVLLNQRVGVLRAKQEALQGFVLHLICSAAFYDFCQRTAGGGAQGNIAPREILEYPIPLPPLATQQAIVAEIEAEQALVDANRKLITRFEKKIQATLARIWGEEEAAPAES
ncbi:MAG: N-6 DNA methylase [Pseudomonadota bacterium]